MDGDAVLLTVNQRLAGHLMRRWDQARLSEGLEVWPTPPILSLEVWLSRQWDAVWPDQEFLTAAQAQTVWQQLVAADQSGPANDLTPMTLLDPHSTAALAWQAWQRCAEWQVDPNSWPAHRCSAESNAFIGWLNGYQDWCREQGCADPAVRLGNIAEAMDAGWVAAPGRVYLAGFDRHSPAFESLLSALAGRGSQITEWPPAESMKTENARVGRLAASDPEDEIRLLARWLRGLWTRMGERVGPESVAVVVPGLAARRTALARALSTQLRPGETGDLPAEWVNLSLGQPLAEVPLVAGALTLLSIDLRPQPIRQLLVAMRSPWLAEAVSEQGARASLADRALQYFRTHASLRQLSDWMAREADPPPVLASRLHAWHVLLEQERGDRSPAAWARHFHELLELLGWPGEMVLTSDNHQAHSRWHDLLTELSALGRVVTRMSRPEAVNHLRRAARQAVFQPEGGHSAPIQVMGTLEAVGMQFDQVWMMGFTDGEWPPAPSPNPFIPMSVQQQLCMPQATAAGELELARTITDRLLASAPRVVVSYVLEADGNPLSPSPLIADLHLIDDLHLAEDVSYALQLSQTDATEQIDDHKAPPLTQADTAEGGASLFQDQAACPFRAFARHRLLARPLADPGPGLDASERGSLLHQVMERVWSILGDSTALQNDAHREQAVALAVQETVEAARSRYHLSPRFEVLERARLTALVLEWLELELTREVPFKVVGREQQTAVTIAGITVKTRLDRVDELADGQRVVLDYKTGQPTIPRWFGDRPEEPQLPLYVSASEQPVEGIVFARLRRNDCGFIGLAADDGLLPRVATVATTRTRLAEEIRAMEWPELITHWRMGLEALATAFAGGEAAVDPARSNSCDYCDMALFCRVADQPGTDGDGSEGDRR